MDIFIFFIFTIFIFSILLLIRNYYYKHPNILTYFIFLLCSIGVGCIFGYIAMGIGYISHTTPFIQKIILNKFIQNISWIFLMVAAIIMPLAKHTKKENKTGN